MFNYFYKIQNLFNRINYPDIRLNVIILFILNFYKI
jgi:hypothetical protein